IIVILFGVSKLVARRVEPRLDAWARGIKGQPGLLRLVVALLRRTDWIIFWALLLLALTVLRSTVTAERSAVISVVLALSLAWLFVSVLTRIVRNRLLARSLGWLAWFYAALVILGIEDDSATFLDSVALPLGAMRLSALVILKAVLLLTATVWLAIVAGNYF